jgi:hypothetical protein
MSMEQVEAPAKPPKASKAKKEEQAADGGDLDAKRAAIEARIAELQQMEGMPTDLVRQAREAVDARRAEIDGLGNQLADLEAQTGARAKTQRDEAHRTKLERDDALRQNLVELEERRLKHVAEAEAGARQFAASLQAAAEATLAQRKIAVALGTKGAGYALDDNALISRCASRLGAVICAHGGRFNNWSRGALGTIRWTATSLYPSNQDWAESEEKLAAPAIIAVIEKKDMI